jgi:hypothetical protein
MRRWVTVFGNGDNGLADAGILDIGMHSEGVGPVSGCKASWSGVIRRSVAEGAVLNKSCRQRGWRGLLSLVKA